MVIDLHQTAAQSTPKATGHEVRHVQHTTCCIVGGGPAGMVMAYMLAQQGIAVMLLEAHKDFDRDFRGDTIHPSVMEIMDELGLAGRLLQRRHTKIHAITLPTEYGPVTPADFRRLKTKFPYITMMPQVDFLEFMADEAQRYPQFQLMMGGRVEELIEEGGTVRGVRYQTDDGWHEVRALLTVGADGRFSRIRRLSGLQAIKTSPPMDVLWFRIPRQPGDPEDAMGIFKPGGILILLSRDDTWQVAYVIAKGDYHRIRETGLPALRESIAGMIPKFADRMEHLQDWKQVSLLSVASDRLPQWYRPGLLLIGDAAHTMSPVGGVGINYAIQDAVAAANILAQPLKSGRVRLDDLRAVQRRREWPTRIIQAIQTFLQRRIIANVLDARKEIRVPNWLISLTRTPFVRTLPARMIAFGIWPVHVKRPA
ncbi:MAG TPA: FAD-dependent oxidoreductase [Herpetosiphonaceae bacterium]